MATRLPISPIRQALKAFLTPSMADVVVTQLEDVQRAKNSDGTTRFPDKGDAHPDSVNYAGYMFAHAEKADDTGQSYFFHYVHARANQDAYNFEYTDADIGPTKFKAVQRTYVNLRSSFTAAAPTMGTAMTNAITGVTASDYILAKRREVRTDDPIIDSLFVIEQLEYVKRATISDITTDKELGIGVKRTTTLYYRGETVGGTAIESLFADPTDAFWGSQDDGTDVDGQQLTDNWFAVITTSSRDDAMNAYLLAVPISVDLALPDVLTGVQIVWNSDKHNGEFESQNVGEWHKTGTFDNLSLNASESASANGSAAVQPELVLSITQPEGRDIPGTGYFFYIKQADGILTSETVISKLNSILELTLPDTVHRWPAFNPVSHNIVLKGQKLSLAAQVSASSSIAASVSGSNEHNQKERSVGVGQDFDFGTTMAVVRIPPTIHPLIDMATGGETGSKTEPVTATCAVGWESFASLITVAGETILLPEVDVASSSNYDEADMAAAAGGKKTVSATITGTVSPTSLSATTPSAIPSSDYYLVDFDFKPYEFGWFKCYAEVIDASDI